MKKNGILSILSIAVLGIGLCACTEALHRSKTGTEADATDVTSKKPVNIKEALAEVVQVLHAPYDKGSLFFKVFTGTTETIEAKTGSESVYIGTGTEAGSGTWSVKAGKAAAIKAEATAENSIIYEYKDYQPNGSPIIVNGSILATNRSKTTDDQAIAAAILARDAVDPIIDVDVVAVDPIVDVDAIQFNTVGLYTLLLEISKLENVAAAETAAALAAFTTSYQEGSCTMVDTLNITGAYEATLTFTYTGAALVQDRDVTASNYDNFLLGKKGIFTFTGEAIKSRNDTFPKNGSKIEFTYAGQTIKLNVNQLKTLLHVAA